MNNDRGILQIVQDIRDFFNIRHRDRLEELMQAPIRYAMFCSCLDVIEDTELALKSLSTENIFVADGNEVNGRIYSLIYGRLQALVMQQDAVKHLYISLQKRYVDPPELENIRRIHIDVVGSPTNIGNSYAFCAIDRSSLSTGRFRIVRQTRTEVGGCELVRSYEPVDISELIQTQHSCFRQVLNNLLIQLRLRTETENETHV